jgi:hypothetical protein
MTNEEIQAKLDVIESNLKKKENAYLGIGNAYDRINMKIGLIAQGFYAVLPFVSSWIRNEEARQARPKTNPHVPAHNPHQRRH